MAPKRLAPSSSHGPKFKKSKLATSQKNLTSFFRSPSKSGQGSSIELDLSEIGDRELAEQLTMQDGIDLETAKNLEESWKNRQTNNGNNPSNAIDVDLDEIPGIGNYMAKRSSSSPDASSPPSLKGKRPANHPFPSTPPRSIAVTSQSFNSLPNYAPLSGDPMTFEIGRAPWPPNTPTPYSYLVHTLLTLSRTRSRILILNSLTNFLRSVSLYHPQSLLPSFYLLSNTLSPPYSSVELGLGPSIISKALQQISGLTPAALSKLYKSFGDLGDVAFTAKSSVRTLVPHPPLSVMEVYDSLLKISRSQGQGATKKKQSLVERLLLSAKGEESRYLVRTLSQNLRVGAVRNTILSALARAQALSPRLDLRSAGSVFYVSPELLQRVQPLPTEGKKKTHNDPARQQVIEIFANAEALVKRIFVQHPNLENIIAALLDVGLEGLAERVHLTVGIPLHPTLGSPTRSLEEVYERLDGLPFEAQLKYDGQRAQVHASQNDTGTMAVKIFSRHLEDMTDKYPDVVALVELLFESNSGLSSFIIDSEIVAVDRETGKLKTFQDLSQRARKDVRLEEVKVSVCLFAFDLMYLNGRALLEKPFRQRRDLLREYFPPLIGGESAAARLGHVESCESEEGRAAVEAFWKKAVEGRSEGLMIKLLENGETTDIESLSNAGNTRRKPLPATYEPDKRTSAWLKLKKDYVEGLGDSLDVVPIAAWHGNGRKSKWWSPILLGLWDAENGEFVAVCKCMSGFSDAFYKDMKNRYPENSEACSEVSLWPCKIGGFRPSVYFKPQEVWEIRGADITVSPVSVAALGLVSSSKGLSIRFPRFIKVRDDKRLDQASTLEFLANMYWSQNKRTYANPRGVDEGQLVDAEWESEAVEEEEGDSS